jgi:hypothetical protein
MGAQSEIFARYRSLYDDSVIQPTESPTSKKIDNLSFVDFLFEIIQSTKGQTQFKDLILKGCMSELKKGDEINKEIINILIQDFGCNSNLLIPTNLTELSVNGIELSKTEIDLFGLLSLDPNQSPGKYLYEGNDITKHVNFFLYKGQTTNENSPISFKYNNNTLFTIYAEDSSTFVFKFGSFYKNKLFGVWLEDYLTAISPIFNFALFLSTITDLVTGALSFGSSKTQIQLSQQNSILAALQKIFGFCSESNTGNNNTNGSPTGYLNNQNGNLSNSNNDGAITTNFGDTQTNDLNNGDTTDYFAFDAPTLDEINTQAQLQSDNLVRFSTCDNLDVPVDSAAVINALNSLFNISKNDTQIVDYTKGNSALSDPSLNLPVNSDPTAYDNTNVKPNVDQATELLSSSISQGLTDLLNGGEITLQVDLPNINAEFQLNILKSIPYAAMQMMLSPKLLLIPKLYGYLSGDTSTKASTEVVNQLSVIIAKIGEVIVKLIINNIFNLIKNDLINLAKNLALNYLKQRGIDYLACLSSLLGLLGIFNGFSSNCTSILDQLLKILKLANLATPMPPIPPPLILVAGALKPGMNHVALMGDIKSALEQKGIVTAPTLPDGSPNNMMIAIEETMKATITHIKTNANISVAVSGSPVLQFGYGQIQ